MATNDGKPSTTERAVKSEYFAITYVGLIIDSKILVIGHFPLEAVKSVCPSRLFVIANVTLGSLTGRIEGLMPAIFDIAQAMLPPSFYPSASHYQHQLVACQTPVKISAFIFCLVSAVYML